MFRFLPLQALEAERFASTPTIMERAIRFKNHNMFEGIFSHIMLNTAFPNLRCVTYKLSR